MVSIRTAIRDDALEMARIEADALRRRAADRYTGEQLRLLLPDDGIPDEEFDGDATRPVVAERDGSVVGWGSLHLEDRSAVIAATFVDPEHARSGVGREIVDHLLSVAREEGYETVTVHASLNAVGFYEVAGFERVREIDIAGPAGAGVDVPAVLMRTTLS